MAFGDGAATVDATRFDQAGCWSAPPELWSDLVDDRLDALATISLTGRIAEVDLSPQMRDDFSALYQRWQEDRDLSTDS
jgi:hypothetical protein